MAFRCMSIRILLALFCWLTVLLYPIDSFSLDNNELSGKVIINEINLSGNKITKPHIITREYVINVGDTLNSEDFLSLVERTRQNIFNTQLFTFVTIHHIEAGGGKVNVHINVEERWYFWPAPIFEIVDRNFNEWWRAGRNFERTNYGINLTRDNFRGRNEKVNFSLRLGYSEAVGFSYSIPYIDKRQRSGVRFSFRYLRRKEVAYGLDESQLQFFRNDDDYVTKSISSSINYTYRDGIYNTNTFWTQYRNSQITDTVLTYNDEYFLPSTTQQESLTIGYRFRSDKRDIRPYPLTGSFFEINVIKQGIGVLRNEPDLLHIISSVRRYLRLSDRFFYHASLKGKISNRAFSPYFNTRGLGYGNDLIRGYEFYVVNGQHFALFKSNLKFNLVKQRVFRSDLIPLEKFQKVPYAFYLNLNADMGYVDDQFSRATNPLSNTFLIGGGVGIDFVTYYDLVMRVEYSVNKFGENGIFLHFRAPI